MIFHSVRFVLFFILITSAFFFAPHRYQKIILLTFSYIFYAFWGIQHLPILLYETAVSYFGGIILRHISYAERKDNNGHQYVFMKRALLALFILLLLLPLTYYKYASFLLRIFTDLSITSRLLNIVETHSVELPVGISFYTMMSVSYVIDSFRIPSDSGCALIDYALSISFFPHLTSGPIDRPASLTRQFCGSKTFSYNKAVYGTKLFVLGLFEKICIADMITPVTDAVFDRFSTFPGSVLFLSAILYTIQLYTDFAGYSYMAIGCASILGYDLQVNFQQPLFASSIGDFWRRWHISLSTWFRDYVYIPLGGNRHGKIRKCINLILTMLVSGFWHGAGWKYIVWGGIHGFLQSAETLLKPVSRNKKTPDGIRSPLNHYSSVAFTFLSVSFAFVLFRIDSLSDALLYARCVVFDFKPNRFYEELLSVADPVLIAIIAVGGLLLFVIDLIHEKGKHISELLPENEHLRHIVYASILLIIFFMYMYHFGEDASGFIYTRF